jgi:hypothetical protein
MYADTMGKIPVMAERGNGRPCNWFQTHEDVMDHAHVGVLHKEQFTPQMTDESGP